MPVHSEIRNTSHKEIDTTHPYKKVTSEEAFPEVFVHVIIYQQGPLITTDGHFATRRLCRHPKSTVGKGH